MQKNNINLETSEEINSSKNIKLDINRPIKSIGVMVYPSDLDMEIKSSEKIKCCFFNMKEDVSFRQKKREKKINIYKCKYCSCFRIQKKQQVSKFGKVIQYFFVIYFVN